jgi:hypothetical protein
MIRSSVRGKVLAGWVLAALGGVLAGHAMAADSLSNTLDVNPKDFTHPTAITNKWMPLKPGVQMNYEGVTVDDVGKKEPWGVIQIVTDLVKNINGIDTVVIWERDYKNGRLEESELAWRAQDDQGNIWHFGEVKEVYGEDNKLIGAKTWMQGRLGAKAGIMMQANPTPGTPSVSQGLALGVYKWDDRGQVRRTGEKVKTALASYDNVLVIEEWSRGELAAGALQLKLYAPDLGYVSVGWEGNDPVKETLELVKVKQLDAKEMAEARAAVIGLDDRSYYYGRETKPLVRRQE